MFIIIMQSDICVNSLRLTLDFCNNLFYNTYTELNDSRSMNYFSIFTPKRIFSARKTNPSTSRKVRSRARCFCSPCRCWLTSIIQQMYNIVDLMFVGSLLGQDASAALGTCSWPINCLVGFFTGMSVGVSVLVSQAYGGKRIFHD